MTTGISRTERIEKKSIEAIIAMNASVQRIRLFSASNPSTVGFVENAYDVLQAIFKEADAFIIEKTSQGIRLHGQSLSEAEQRKTQVTGFFDLIFSFDLQSVAFGKGITREELSRFLEIISQKPENLKEGGLEAEIEDLDHIHLDGKKALEASAQTAGAIDTQNLAPMICTLQDLLDEDSRGDVCKHLGDAVLAKGLSVIRNLLSQKNEAPMAAELNRYIVEKMDEAALENLLKEVAAARLEPSSDPEREAAAKQLYRNIHAVPRGKEVYNRLSYSEHLKMKTGLEQIIKKDFSVYSDSDVMIGLPGAIERFLAKENDKNAPAILDKMADAILEAEPDVRKQIAENLPPVLDLLIVTSQLDTLLRMSYKLVGWIRQETIWSSGYEEVCFRMETLARTLIEDGRFDNCRHILKIFNAICTGKLEKPSEMKDLACGILERIASGDFVQSLTEDLRAQSEDKRKEATDRLSLLGVGSLDRLLNRLRESESRTERSRILRVIYGIGNAAVPALEREIKKTEIPWYYIRNLILLLGKVGNESQVKTLRPFLEYEDDRVQRETLNSLFNFSGEESRKMVLDALYRIDDQLKLNVAGMLGAWKDQSAVQPLIRLFESEALAASEVRDELALKICNALGSIGSSEATPLINWIEEILEQKRKPPVMNKGDSEAIRSALKSALENIRQNGAEKKKDESGRSKGEAS